MEPIQPQTTWKRWTSLKFAIFLLSSLTLSQLLLRSRRNFILVSFSSFLHRNKLLICSEALLRRETSSRERERERGRSTTSAWDYSPVKNNSNNNFFKTKRKQFYYDQRIHQWISYNFQRNWKTVIFLFVFFSTINDVVQYDSFFQYLRH